MRQYFFFPSFQVIVFFSIFYKWTPITPISKLTIPQIHRIHAKLCMKTYTTNSTYIQRNVAWIGLKNNVIDGRYFFHEYPSLDLCICIYLSFTHFILYFYVIVCHSLIEFDFCCWLFCKAILVLYCIVSCCDNWREVIRYNCIKLM